MPKIISFDMDGTLIDPEFTDWVWSHGIPTLYAKKKGIEFEEAKALVEEEYRRVGEGSIEWYDIKYWLNFFGLDPNWKALMEQYVDKIRVYSDVNHILDRLKDRSSLIITSNAGREFIDIELEATGIGRYFDRIFSATSDFGQIKKTVDFYHKICEIMGVAPGEMIHVGDHYEFDYIVPRSIGIHAFYLDRSEKQKGEFIISGLKELEKIVSVTAIHRTK